MTPGNRKLRRSRNRMIAGVCGGLAEWLGWPANRVRIAYVVISVLSAAFPGMRILPEAEWTVYRTSLVSSSYLKLGSVLRWFTGNIGFHHVHHLNSLIPFYRLPDAMAAIV